MLIQKNHVFNSPYGSKQNFKKKLIKLNLFLKIQALAKRFIG